jgi:hypothetical protein
MITLQLLPGYKDMEILKFSVRELDGEQLPD